MGMGSWDGKTKTSERNYSLLWIEIAFMLREFVLRSATTDDFENLNTDIAGH